MIQRTVTMAEFKKMMERKSAKKTKRRENARFIAKMKGGRIVASRTTIKAQLFDLSSRIVRRRDAKLYSGLCLVCVVKRALGFQSENARPIECAYHIEPRGDAGVAFRLDNQVGSCWPCNKGEKHSRDRASTREHYRKIHVYLVGEDKLLELARAASETVQKSDAELIELRDKYKKMMEEGRC